MIAIIGALISILGAFVSDIDFFEVYTIVTIALEINEFWKKCTDDKTTKR